jgi:hypothetical protein
MVHGARILACRLVLSQRWQLRSPPLRYATLQAAHIWDAFALAVRWES